jgi:hypothetical protein
MVWGAFSNFNRCFLIIKPQGERNATYFVHHIYEAILNSFYFMHNHHDEFTLLKDGALVCRSKLLVQWREAHGMKKLV